ncbi:NADH dehydrogenase [ubiquinone] 1 alpha subcomplex subunit 13-like [Vespa mandarinia]|uniref:NADH dehydrogenase [ubiquinone] 1 alpha subcomplex subunit 13-like n=1 Tax=Vespa mandarinia TaxID=7446 RepID=UPI00160B9B6F|nr:NADH dehydrogenase [ubiquinone] 1 alpha subcomplex subunit 13-like [Vespa mandarinia]
MNTATKGFTQDLPPKEGYRPITTERIPLRTLLGGRSALGLCLVTTVVGHYLYFIEWKKIKREIIEMRSAQFALQPILQAERDRIFLKQVKRNVAEEKELMKNYPEWKVGTYKGEPIYKTIPEDKFIEPSHLEYFIHSHPHDFEYQHYLRMIS